jgi:hypothetical protein
VLHAKARERRDRPVVSHEGALDFDLAMRRDELLDDPLVEPEQSRRLVKVPVGRLGRFHVQKGYLPTSGTRHGFFSPLGVPMSGLRLPNDVLANRKRRDVRAIVDTLH